MLVLGAFCSRKIFFVTYVIFQNGRQCTSRDFVDILVTLVHQNIRVFCEVLQIILDCKAVKNSLDLWNELLCMYF